MDSQCGSEVVDRKGWRYGSAVVDHKVIRLEAVHRRMVSQLWEADRRATRHDLGEECHTIDQAEVRRHPFRIPQALFVDQDCWSGTGWTALENSCDQSPPKTEDCLRQVASEEHLVHHDRQGYNLAGDWVLYLVWQPG